MRPRVLACVFRGYFACVYVLNVQLHEVEDETSRGIFLLHSAHMSLHVTLDPIRCTLYVKPGGDRVLTSGQNQLFPLRGYTDVT